MTNHGSEPATVVVIARAFVHRALVRTQPIAISLFNHAYRVLL